MSGIDGELIVSAHCCCMRRHRLRMPHPISAAFDALLQMIPIDTDERLALVFLCARDAATLRRCRRKRLLLMLVHLGWVR
ncbi:hypothetical protein XdyCFBP7245_10410 [Xanthomonas dyei]|uniref:Uncharacterized protein n=2 Tax=Xanthomonas dyei TaxID=743699 RepID=A0A2S7C3D8_9XANT|nr:hypothetical protein XdyCFBP7245_10410 [Xanthomonas dyei]